METQTIVLATMALYNIIVAVFAFKIIQNVDYKSAIAEKNPDTISAAAQVAAQQPNANVSTSILPSSYSRITGMFGMLILAAFLWALGNSIIYSSFVSPENISKIMNGIGTFFLSGSALFAPYAFNQMKEAWLMMGFGVMVEPWAPRRLQ